MKTFKQLKESLSENHIDVAMGRELDDEGAMIMNQIEEIKHCCDRLKASITSPTMQVPGWVQSKVTLAADYMDSVASYMDNKNEEFVKEEAEKRYCPKCEKEETKSECSYGSDYWENNAKSWLTSLHGLVEKEKIKMAVSMKRDANLMSERIQEVI